MQTQACGAQGSVRYGDIRNGQRGMARFAPRRRRDGFGSGRDGDRRGRHGRRRRLHQPRLPGQGHPLRLLDPAAVERRRHRRAMRGVFLWRAGGDVPALQRRVQFSQPRLPSRVRVRRRLGLRNGRLRRARCAGRDGVRRIWQGGSPGCAAADARGRHGVAGIDRAAHRRQAFIDLPIDRDHPEGGADRSLPRRGLRHQHAAAGVFRAVASRPSRRWRVRRSRSAWCS